MARYKSSEVWFLVYCFDISPSVPLHVDCISVTLDPCSSVRLFLFCPRDTQQLLPLIEGFLYRELCNCFRHSFQEYINIYTK